MKAYRQRRTSWCALAVILAVVSCNHKAHGSVTSFDDITYWVGSGSQSAGLIIDWNGGPNPPSLAWGFRWDGQATGHQMLTAILNADPRFGGVILTDWGWGWTIDGLGYDLNENGFDINDPGDHYNPGYVDPAFWAYYTYDDATHPWDGGDNWTLSDVGMGDRTLADGSWDGWSYTFWGDNGPAAAVPAVIPEPGVVSLLFMGAVLLGVHRYRSRP